MNDALPNQDMMAMQMICAGNQQALAVFQSVVDRQAKSIAVQNRALNVLTSAPSTLAFESSVLPLCIRNAAGGRITDIDGNEYIDCHMAYTASILGHNPPTVAEAVSRALARGVGGGCFFEEQVELAELIIEMVPGLDRTAFFHTGGESVNAAVRFARAATGKRRVAKFEGCYHGANAIGLHNTWMILSGRPPTGPLDDIKPSVSTAGIKSGSNEDFLVLPYNSPVALEQLRKHAAELACVVVDPVPMFMGPYVDDAKRFIRELGEVTTEFNIPLVFDEVVGGFRLARGGAREWAEVTPQMSCFGKITSGLGVPLSIVGGDAKFLDTAKSNGLFKDYAGGKTWVASTLAGNFLAVIASLAQLRYVAEHYDVIAETLARNRSHLLERLADFAKRSGIPIALHGDPRLQMQLGFTDHAHAEKNYRSVMSDSSPQQFMSLVALTFYLRSNGIYTKLIPSMNLSAGHNEADIEQLANGIEKSLEQMSAHAVIKY